MTELTHKDTMSSREIARITGKPHNDVMKSIRNMEHAWKRVTGGNFSLSEYKDSTGRKLPQYQLNKTECLYIATKFNNEARARLVIRWAELEEKEKQNTLRMPAPKIFNQVKCIHYTGWLLQNGYSIMSGQVRAFQIDNGKLVISAYQRSSDASLGLPADLYHLYLISRQIDLALKSITLTLGNVHIYENNIDSTKRLLKGEKVSFELNV